MKNFQEWKPFYILENVLKKLFLRNYKLEPTLSMNHPCILGWCLTKFSCMLIEIQNGCRCRTKFEIGPYEKNNLQTFKPIKNKLVWNVPCRSFTTFTFFNQYITMINRLIA